MTRLSLRRTPVALLVSPAPWNAAWYLLAYLFTGAVLFAIALTATVTASALCITLAGLPLLVGAALVVRGCADVERARLAAVRTDRIRAQYRPPARSGLMAQITTRWTDPALWRDLAYLLALWPALLALDTAALSVWLLLLAGITLPAWYRFPHQNFGIIADSGPTGRAHGVQIGYFPHGPFGHPGWGVFVNTMPKALAVAGACLILFLLYNYVLVAAARLHATIASSLLRPPEDPLHEAREVLLRPGPLTTALPYDPR
jgi:Putative sensor